MDPKILRLAGVALENPDFSQVEVADLLEIADHRDEVVRCLVEAIARVNAAEKFLRLKSAAADPHPPIVRYGRGGRFPPRRSS